MIQLVIEVVRVNGEYPPLRDVLLNAYFADEPITLHIENVALECRVLSTAEHWGGESPSMDFTIVGKQACLH